MKKHVISSGLPFVLFPRNYSNFSAGEDDVHTLLFIGTCIDNVTGNIT